MAYRYLHWGRLVKTLKDYLINYTYEDGTRLFNYINNRDDLKILVGSGNAGEYPLIEIKLGDESGIGTTPRSCDGGKTQIWLDIFLKGDDTEEGNMGESLYDQIYNVEEEIVWAIDGYRELIQKTFKIATTIAVSIWSDGDVNTPVTITHRLVLDIDWKKL